MKFKFDKSMKILTDIASYCRRLGAREFNMHFSDNEGSTYFTIVTRIPDIRQEDLEQLVDALNLPRQKEIEQNYWNLSGETDTSSELSLLGVMLDNAVVNYTDGVLTIEAERH